MNPIDLVDSFHKAFAYRQPTPQLPMLDSETIEFRMTMMHEEKEEFRVAVREEPRANQLKELCDIQYVLSGAILALGMRQLFEQCDSLDLTRHSKTLEVGPRIILFGMKLKYTGELLNRKAIGHAALALRDLQCVLDGLIFAMKFTRFAEAFFAVHLNNMAKLWPYDVAMMGNWPDLTFEVSSQAGMYIARRADGKICKPPAHAKVDLTEFCK